MKHSSLAFGLLTAILSAPLWTAGTVHADECVVDNTSDSDAGTLPATGSFTGSLRFCLNNARSGDAITFDPNVFNLVNSDAATTIPVLTDLPPLAAGGVTIEASDRRVTVNGSGAGSSSGLQITSSNNAIRGVTIVGFSGSGIQILSGTSNVIGGSRSVGTGPNGQGLRIAGCGAFGVEISGSGTNSNVVKGCWIGLDASGAAPQANLAGVVVQGGSATNTLGGADPSEGNVVSGNTLEGITVADAGSDNNVIIGNIVGASAVVTAGRSQGRSNDDTLGGRSALGNGSAGIFLSKGTNGTQVGGDTGQGNLIGFNGGNGVEVRATLSKSNSARGNNISHNKKGGIALFDGSNNGVLPPTITNAEAAPPDGSGVAKFRVTGTTTQSGSIEVFNDSADQGSSLLGRGAVAGGAFAVDVDAALVTNLTATFTDDNGNTSEFGVFGLTTGDTDGDGVADVLETLAGTDPANPLSTPTRAGALTISKLSIKLNFAKSNNDSIKATTSITLPPGLPLAGLNVGIYVAGVSGQLVLDAKGKAKSPSGTVAIALKTEKTGTTTLKYSIKKSALQADVAPVGLTDRTTDKAGDALVAPVAVTIGSSTGPSVYFGAVTQTYKAKQGKTGATK